MDHMEFSISLPPYVEFTNAGNEWTNMKQRLNTHGSYSSDSQHHQHEGLVKAFLINIAAEQVQEIFNMFGLSYEEALKFSQILQRLEDVCVPRFLIIYNRFKFFTCRQTYSDKFDDFLRDLLNWSENCEFGDLRDILLKDCIITGILDNSVRQRLLETEELDFSKTIDICRVVERRQSVRHALVNTHTTVLVDASMETENSANESEQIQEVVKKFSDTSTNTVPDEFSVGITKEINTDSAKDDMKSVMHSSSVEPEDILEPLDLSDVIQNCGKMKIDTSCPNSEADDIASKQTKTFKVLRRSERNKKVGENDYKSGPKIDRTAEYIFEKESNTGKKLDILKKDLGLNKTDGSKNIKLKISKTYPRINKTIKHKDVVESKSGKKFRISITDCGINIRTSHTNEMESSDRKKQKLLQTESTIIKTQDHKEMKTNVEKKLKLSLKALVDKRRSSDRTENASIMQEGLGCSFCGQSFPDKISILSHIQKTHDKKHVRSISLKCRVCKAVFTDLTALRLHRSVHKSEKKFKCDFCPAKFGNPSHLKVHMRLHTGERPYTCDTCGASYPEASKLKAHIRKHTGEKPYHCSICSRTFAWTASYTRHMRTHTGERPYTCEFCGVNFADFTSLQRHIRTHTLEKPYHCTKCTAKFTDPSALKLHNRIHNGERPYVCGTCGTSFIRSQHLKEHLKLHTGEKPFRCDTCGAKFAEASKLKSHGRKHTGEKPYLCKICGTRFAWTAAFTRHMRTHTMEKPYVCDFCGSHFADHSTLTRHRRTHTGERPYPCKICDTYFADNSSLHRHMRIHTGEKSYTCEVCGSSFAVKSYLVRHMRTHTGEKPYGCDVCSSKFTDSSKLNRHKKTHLKTQGKREKQKKSPPQQTQKYEQLQPVQKLPLGKEDYQQPGNEKLDTWKNDQQHLISVVHNLHNPILITATLLPLNNTLHYNSSVFS